MPPDDDVVVVGKYALYDYDSVQNFATPNFMVLTNWKDYASYTSTTKKSPSSLKDAVGSLVGDCVNNWMGIINATIGIRTLVTGPHAKVNNELAEGGNFVFSDGHGRWFTKVQLSNLPQWSDGTGRKYYWPESD